MEGDESARDAAYYAFHELTNFPPALRCLHILVSGQTPTISDCAALSQSMLEVLKSYMPMEAITLDPARLFEGSRLAFGFILESAKSIRKSADGDRGNDEEVVDNLRYTSAFHTYDVRDHQTREPVLHALQTSNGLMESELFHSLQSGGILAETHLHASLARAEIDPRLRRFALQGGGTCPEVLVLSLGGLKDCYGSQEGVTPSALDLDQLLDLNHLAILSGQSGLAVHMPSQLISAIAPSLVFDRNAHVAVYTGEQPCAAPGRSSIISRPQHGEETIDPSVIEQLIAPIIKEFEQDGSAVFDAFGGAEVRRLQDPDEIIMFCVDSSASMGGETDFREVNQESPRLDEQSHSPAEGELHTALSLEMTKESLIAYEGFTDMISIIATALNHQQNLVTGKVLSILASMLSSEIITKSKALEKEQKSAIGPSWVTRISDLESNLQKLKAFGSGLKVHEEAVAQFLRYRASCLNVHGWMWSVGDPVPAVPGRKTIPILPHDMTEVPSHLKCPISHCLMEDAVKASDGQIYSRSAIQQWFAIRKTSPLHGAPLRDLSLAVEPDIRYEVVSWIAGTAMRSPSDVITVTFESRVGSFTRNIARTTTSRDLYRLAYRGLKARYEAFELSMHWFGMLSASSDIEVSSMRLRDFDHVMVRIPEDADTSQVRPHNAPRTVGDQTPEMCLVKVFEHTKSQLFGFWVPRDTTDTLTSIIWKYWRHQLHENPYLEPSRRQARTNVTEFGDGWYSCDYPEDATKLATYLTTDRCTGQLEPESVFKGSSANTSGSQSIHKVLKVIITKPNKVARSQKLTRLDVLKQMFEALINRMLAYNYRNHVGLVKFSSHAQVTMPISHVLENFRRATNELKGGGDTALWDALALAGDQIEQYASRFPGAKKRIVVISDGVDTNSKTNTSHSITLGLFQKGISVDSVSLGGEDNVDLRTLSYLLGSYRFHPTSLSNALAICEMEPFLSLSQRPSITFPPRNLASPARFETVFYQSRTWATATLVTDETIPPIREHPNMEDDVVQLTTLASRRNATARGLGDSSSASNGSVRSRLRVPRLMNEIKTVAARGAHGSYDVYISTADMSFWKIVVGGPDGSPYSDGVFLLYLHADDGYPTFAPKARFVTKIRHPNVNAHGRICHSIFDRDWTSDTSMGAILDTIYGLLFQPESSDPVSTMSTLGFFQEPAAFAREAREHTRKHASKTREEWKAELLD
ncbi:hypothetical protein Daus18300_000999 [Diaporthe australafricana]|uniref:peptidylprolyl isomerase n=1 Tax=Diaporthe australafricana TaxID=127596 RepID=A0ABR3Y1Y9_9PEZI